jgi:tRNA A-37 threonylcarbamoyl transferase component Bud32/tetratricopeptide (TPR) repeat protein
VNQASGAVAGVFAGRYTIERELGRGATSIVYLARELATGRAVAIKILRTELVTEISTERFLREIRVTARLEHPNIVPVLDSGEYDDRLFFVLPHMEGGTLRARLEREKQLPIGDVITIGKTIAAALQFAHEHKLLHRDVKPENILFSRGEACLADFGIARAWSEASGETGPSSTSTGVVRGTPAYMSPEQAAGDRDIDARSDIYSLACVLYEALAGIAAFVGPTPQSILAQRLAHVPRGVRVYRPAAPVALERVLERALGLAPADRHQSAAEFRDALANAVDSAPVSLHPMAPSDQAEALSGGPDRLPWPVRALGAVGVIVAVGLATYGSIRVRDRAAASPDTLTYAVLPADSGTARATNDVASLLRESLRRWTGIVVADPDRVGDAGRRIRLQLTPIGDSLRLRATLIDVTSKTAIADVTVRLPPTAAHSDSIVTVVADRLLFPEVAALDSRESGGGTSSFPARRAFLRGRAAMDRFDLARADSEFRRATEFDAKYATASLHLAQVRQWMGHPIAQWGYSAEQAQAGKAQLSPDDRLLADALVHLVRGRRDAACAAWRQLTNRDQDNFDHWYSLGNCLRYDSVVVRDPSSPSRWRFRSSYQQAVNAYDRAFTLLPGEHRFVGVKLVDDVASLLMLSGPSLRAGRSIAPDTMQFNAWPAWDADSLAFVPLPLAQFDVANRATSRSAAANQAILQDRHRFVQIALRWRSQLPESAEAAEALARALDLLGNVSAFDTLRVARRLAHYTDRLRLGALEVLMRVKNSVPSDSVQLRAARALADSLLREYTGTDQSGMKLVASLAALTGRANLAARYSHSVEASAVAPALERSAPALLAFAAIGGPTDSIRVLEADVWRAIDTSVLPSQRPSAIDQWLERAAFLAIPNYRFTASAEFSQVRRSAGLIAAWERKDLKGARRIVGELRDQRRRAGLHAGDMTIDAVYAEAAVLASLSDANDAIAWLDPVIDSMSFAPPQQLADVARAGPLVRAMALRADLAHAEGDRAAAKKWARAVIILWSDADPFLTPVVERMRSYAK